MNVLLNESAAQYQAKGHQMTEIPDRYLEQALADKIDELAHDMLLGENAGPLFAEIERMTLSKDKADIDGLRDMSVADIAERVAENIAGRMLDNGDLDEAALDLASDDAERIVGWW